MGDGEELGISYEGERVEEGQKEKQTLVKERDSSKAGEGGY